MKNDIKKIKYLSFRNQNEDDYANKHPAATLLKLNRNHATQQKYLSFLPTIS